MTNYQLSDVVEYRARSHINIYDSPRCDRLATQAMAGRHLRVVELPLVNAGIGVNFDTRAVMVRLCEDDYPGWLDLRDVESISVAQIPYHPVILSETKIREKLPKVIDFAHQAMDQSNEYLWGGTVGPNYDCSGLMQAAFRSAGIWLPRDAYQQEAFTKPISITCLEPGDLVFFGTPEKATHVGLYLGGDRYIHSSGTEQGRNGIGIDILSEDGDRVSQAYYRQLRGYGKVVASYQPIVILNHL
ncbi:NlpC/P60 family protein [Microcoleus sp.]|uniref:C40 family peptidase n=1 Tax=Microcoleus sp. TaxID=44472 RepID=UPI0035260F33